ncbi:polyprenyl synthetase family protein [Candidatus Woesearchaeota archaeon]|nr:polyprenyl synthetase family protein [Candidatus Woesearchaeota archaeon]
MGLDMKGYFSSTLPLIEAAAKDFFPKEIDAAWLSRNIAPAAYPFDTDIWQPVISSPFYDLFDRGGKRLRPVLTCLTHQALGGDDPKTYQLSIIPEFIHSGTLIVDDIEDGSSFRRGKECVHKIHGIETSINNGNFLYFFPQMAIRRSALPEDKKALLYGIIVEEITKLHLGQGMDIYWGKNNMFSIGIDDYLQMSAYKTGALLSIAMKIGAVMAGADKATLAKLGDIAVSMGIAFQIQDDILNLKPTKEWGKESGEDITEGKLTYMVVHAVSVAEEADRAELIRLLSSHTKDRAEIDRAIAILDRYGSFQKAKALSVDLISKAKESIDSLFPDSDYRRVYLEILDFLIERNK